MNCNQFDKTERQEMPRQGLPAAPRGVLLAARGQVRSKNRELSKAELVPRHRLDRKD